MTDMVNNLIVAGWIPLENDKPGSHEYYLVTHLTSKQRWARPEIFKWHQLDFYRQKNICKNPMTKPIDMGNA